MAGKQRGQHINCEILKHTFANMKRILRNDLAELGSATKRRRRWGYQGALGPLICFISLQR
jgi:hypothetical protein